MTNFIKTLSHFARNLCCLKPTLNFNQKLLIPRSSLQQIQPISNQIHQICPQIKNQFKLFNNRAPFQTSFAHPKFQQILPYLKTTLLHDAIPSNLGIFKSFNTKKSTSPQILKRSISFSLSTSTDVISWIALYVSLFLIWPEIAIMLTLLIIVYCVVFCLLIAVALYVAELKRNNDNKKDQN